LNPHPPPHPPPPPPPWGGACLLRFSSIAPDRSTWSTWPSPRPEASTSGWTTSSRASLTQPVGLRSSPATGVYARKSRHLSIRGGFLAKLPEGSVQPSSPSWWLQPQTEALVAHRYRPPPPWRSGWPVCDRWPPCIAPTSGIRPFASGQIGGSQSFPQAHRFPVLAPWLPGFIRPFIDHDQQLPALPASELALAFARGDHPAWWLSTCMRCRPMPFIAKDYTTQASALHHTSTSPSS